MLGVGKCFLYSLVKYSWEKKSFWGEWSKNMREHDIRGVKYKAKKIKSSGFYFETIKGCGENCSSFMGFG